MYQRLKLKLKEIPKFRFKDLLALDDSPEKIAAAFAVGVFIAFSPLLGLHMAMVILSAWLFRLNFVPVLMGALVNNPWTFAPLYGASTWFGVLLYGGDFPEIVWRNVTLMDFLSSFKPYLGPFFLGTTVLGSVFALLSYFGIYLVIRLLKKSRLKLET